MNIATFEKQFNQTILKRGYNYYLNGQVEDLVQIDAYNWQAEVDGTTIYVVDIRINDNGEIVYADCDCPYEDDCKHIAAVLYEIQQQQATPKPSISASKKATTNTKKPTLQQLLQSQTKEQLIALITKVGQNHPAFIKELEMLLIMPEDVLQSAKKLISHYIKAAQDRRSGFINWNQTSKALKGIETTQEHIHEYLEKGEYVTALQLSLLCFHHTFEAMQYSDDSSGDFGYAMEESIALIEQAIWEGVDVWQKEQYKTIYELITQEALNPELDDWLDWRLHLLQACIPLCYDDAIEDQFKALLHSLEGNEERWNAQYTKKQLKELHLQLLMSKYNQEEVDAFLEQNIEDDNMRERVILSAIKRNDYPKVLQLALDGLQHDQQSSGIMTKWKQYAFTAHKQLGHTEDMRELAVQLLLHGDYLYYEELKALYSAEQWPNVLEQLLNRLKKAASYLYPQLIIEEQKHKRLLDYCKDLPSRIEQYYSYINEQYYEEVCALFIEHITSDANFASNRKSYQAVCRSIITMRKAGYTFEAKQLIADLLQTYPKRRAFVEELQKIQQAE